MRAVSFNVMRFLYFQLTLMTQMKAAECEHDLIWTAQQHFFRLFFRKASQTTKTVNSQGSKREPRITQRVFVRRGRNKSTV